MLRAEAPSPHPVRLATMLILLPREGEGRREAQSALPLFSSVLSAHGDVQEAVVWLKCTVCYGGGRGYGERV